jgi:hypothetical protein
MPRKASKVTQALEANYERLMQMAQEEPDQVYDTIVNLVEPFVGVPNGITEKAWQRMKFDYSSAHTPEDWQYHISNSILNSLGMGTLDKRIGPKGHLKRDYRPRNETVVPLREII